MNADVALNKSNERVIAVRYVAFELLPNYLLTEMGVLDVSAFREQSNSTYPSQFLEKLTECLKIAQPIAKIMYSKGKSRTYIKRDVDFRGCFVEKADDEATKRHGPFITKLTFRTRAQDPVEHGEYDADAAM